MAVFMPTDFKSLSINNFLKLQQYPSHILTNENILKPYFNIGVAESQNSLMSNVVNATSPIMTDLSDQQQNLKVKLCSANTSSSFDHDDNNSNDSDLSVGQEKVHSEQSQSNNNNNNNINNIKINNSTNNNNKSSNNNVKESVNSDDDEMSNASSSQYTNSSTRLCSPQNSREMSEIMRPIQFHEEILRSSQFYAEEILRQRIAAAARLQNVVDTKAHHHLHPLTNNDEPEPSIISKLNFQSNFFSTSNKQHAADNNGNNGGVENGNNNIFCAKSAINFQNIHSHLSAISQITHNLGNNNIKKDDATSLSSLSRESSQSPSGFQQYKQQNQHKHGFHTSTHQNQLHEHNLKFSIDNILKADFGRRITEPLLKTSRMKRSLREGKNEKEKIKNFTAVDTSLHNDLTSNNSSMTKDKSLEQSYSTSTETSKSDPGTSSSSTSNQVWPAWVIKHFIFHFFHSQFYFDRFLFNFF
jgi:hypothetical protein